MPLPIPFEVQRPRPEGVSPDRLHEANLGAMRRSILHVLRRATLNLTGRFLRVRSNRLRSSLTTLVRIEGRDVIGIVGTNVFYGRIHEEGRPGPWTIVPRRRKALRFTVGGRTVFARRVTHPGLRPRPWLSTALKESHGEIEAEFRRALEAVLAGRG